MSHANARLAPADAGNRHLHHRWTVLAAKLRTVCIRISRVDPCLTAASSVQCDPPYDWVLAFRFVQRPIPTPATRLESRRPSYLRR